MTNVVLKTTSGMNHNDSSCSLCVRMRFNISTAECECVGFLSFLSSLCIITVVIATVVCCGRL